MRLQGDDSERGRTDWFINLNRYSEVVVTPAKKLPGVRERQTFDELGNLGKSWDGDAAETVAAALDAMTR